MPNGFILLGVKAQDGKGFEIIGKLKDNGTNISSRGNVRFPHCFKII